MQEKIPDLEGHFKPMNVPSADSLLSKHLLWLPWYFSLSLFSVPLLILFSIQSYLIQSVHSQTLVWMLAFIICLPNCSYASPVGYLPSTHPVELISFNHFQPLSFPHYIVSVSNYMQPLKLVIILTSSVFTELTLETNSCMGYG